MLSIIFIYFVGKPFYKLAESHDRNKWGFAILGVISYYLGYFIFGFLILIGIELWSDSSIDDIDDIVLNLMFVPFGILSCVGLYFLLKRIWSKDKKVDENLIDEIGKS